MNQDSLINNLGLLKSRITTIEPEEKKELYLQARSGNGWFTEDNIEQAFQGIIHYLDHNKLKKWLDLESSYSTGNIKKEVGIVMAGNIPLVGFHDMLSVICSGHIALVKTSSQDNVLMTYIINALMDIDPELKSRIKIIERLKKPDAVIATGSDNTARYFNYYFKDIPHIIRKNRTSVAVITGKENVLDLQRLGSDIFTYFGLGCRNVSKLFIPENFDFNQFFKGVESFEYVTSTQKYVNNYDYNKSIFLVNKEEFLDNGFLLLRQSEQLVSPVSVLYFEKYSSQGDVFQKIDHFSNKIQCVITTSNRMEGSIAPGKSQHPELWDYADNLNTMEFLRNI